MQIATLFDSFIVQGKRVLFRLRTHISNREAVQVFLRTVTGSEAHKYLYASLSGAHEMTARVVIDHHHLEQSAHAFHVCKEGRLGRGAGISFQP